MRSSSVLGSHTCECGDPEMRRVPDGTFLRSEMLPLGAPAVDWTCGEYGEAYQSGWIDGRFAEPGCFTENPNLASWQDASDRLAYYRGHRAGSQARKAAATIA